MLSRSLLDPKGRVLGQPPPRHPAEPRGVQCLQLSWGQIGEVPGNGDQAPAPFAREAEVSQSLGGAES